MKDDIEKFFVDMPVVEQVEAVHELNRIIKKPPEVKEAKKEVTD